MPTVATDQTEVERVLVDVTSLLLERARIALEREVEASGDSPESDAAISLARVRELEDALRSIRQRQSAKGAVPASVPGRQVSKFYEVPGQEDA
jgi:hypothetical protein